MNLDQTITRCLGRRDDRSLCENSYECKRHLAIRTDLKLDELPPVSLYMCVKDDCFIEVMNDKARATEDAPN